MIDREKVMWSLARCSCGVPDACSDCHYNNYPSRICVQHLTSNARALLKAQKPRVMTLEEVKAKPDYAWIEKLDSKKTYIVLFNFMAVLSDLSSYAHTWNHYGKDELLLLLLYNKTWRCWTSQPDDKRRAETPWD